ncbi:MAG: BatA domain-containing protein [Acidobacteriota bacterium]|nr:BatA domain-containing protein [Acidobacteriota bacterium]
MFGVSFLSPLFLIGALAAAVPILLHLFHRRTEVVIDFPAVSLLTRAPIEQHRRRRLREIVLLVLRIAALVLLAVSFARPYVAGAIAPESAPVTVVVADTSMSLSAPGQIERVREAALNAIRSAPAPNAVALVAFADAATVVVPATTDRAVALAAVPQLAAGPGGTRYRTALARAAELIGAREGRVVVITDLQQAGWEVTDEGGLPDGVGVEVVAIPPPSSNVAVTSAERRDRTVVATVQNYGPDPARMPVALMVDGKKIATVTVDVAPLSATDARLNGAIPAAGAAQVVVDDATGYQGDNIRHLVLEPRPAIEITVVVADPSGATGGLYVERALAVAGGGREFKVDAVDGRVFSSWTAEAVSRQGAIVLVGTRTLDRTGRALVKNYLANGGHVWLTLGPDIDPATLGDVIGANLGVIAAPVTVMGGTIMVASDGRHPIFRPFLNPSGALGDVQVDQHRRLNDQTGRTVLARFSGGDPALTEQVVGQGRLLIFTSDLDNHWSRFPLSPAFVPFAVETARYLTAGRQQKQAWVLPDVPRGIVAAPGVATVSEGTTAPYLVAVNVNVRESSPATTSLEEFTAGIERTSRAGLPAPVNQAREIENRQRWWQIGLLVMLVALAGEGLVGRRAT